MLVLSRRHGQFIDVTFPDGRRGRIGILSIRYSNGEEIQGDIKVRVGVEFPRDVIVHREEVQAEIDGE